MSVLVEEAVGMTNPLIKITTNEKKEPVVSGRDLHEFLGSKEPYTQWFDRMKEYGFIEDVDFSVFQNFVNDDTAFGGVRKLTDHVIKLDMAKELAMIQRTERGKQARQYFLAIEKEFNSPERIMARALRIADETIHQLQLTVEVQTQQIAEMEPKVTYYDLVLRSASVVPIGVIASDYGMSARAFNEMLHKMGVQYRQSKIWLLYSKYRQFGYTKTVTQPITHSDGRSGTAVHTYWTQKGRLFLYDLLKMKKILPVMEREGAA